jgi:hypothetical protein
MKGLPQFSQKKRPPTLEMVSVLQIGQAATLEEPSAGVQPGGG